MKNVNWKELFIDILVDIVAGMIIAVGIYNFALNADFPVAGFSGIAIILYHIFGLYGVHKVRPVRITEIKTKVS